MNTDAFIDTWSQAERAEMLGALTKLRVGVVKNPSSDNEWYLLFRHENIAPQQCITLSESPHCNFKPKRLFILEPTIAKQEVVKTHFLHNERKELKRTWYGKTKQISLPCEVKEEKEMGTRLTTFPRSAWRVRTILVGQYLQFPSMGDISGDLFGPDSVWQFKDECSAALSISLCVQNITTDEVPFFAVVTGSVEK